MERAKTPPLRVSTAPGVIPQSPPTPEVRRRIEENRLKAKAIRDQREAAERQSGKPSTIHRTPSGFIANPANDISIAGRKRAHGSISTSNISETRRDGRNASPGNRGSSSTGGGFSADGDIQAAKKFTKYVDYNLSKMVDTKGGFLTAEDDPFNKALHAPQEGEKPAHMSLKEWERLQLLRSLRQRKEGPYEPGLSVLNKEKDKKCRECGSLEIDWTFEETFKVMVCRGCQEKLPDKYSLLTKTQAKQDYLLTDPELKDIELLPHMNKPNPHKSHWHDMMLFMREQLEDYAIKTKWGSEEAMDAEFFKREEDKKKRKDAKFQTALRNLKKKTRTEQYRRSMKGAGGTFGDAIGNGKHEHEWRSVENADGVSVSTCVTCGMEVEEEVL